MALKLTWVKRGMGWYAFDDFSSVFFGVRGVYIIWHSAGSPRNSVIYVGKGEVDSRLIRHQLDERVLLFINMNLMVTCAAVPEIHLDGVEAFLHKTLKPVVGERYPDVAPVRVNLPWDDETT